MQPKCFANFLQSAEAPKYINGVLLVRKFVSSKTLIFALLNPNNDGDTASGPSQSVATRAATISNLQVQASLEEQFMLTANACLQSFCNAISKRCRFAEAGLASH